MKKLIKPSIDELLDYEVSALSEGTCVCREKVCDCVCAVVGGCNCRTRTYFSDSELDEILF